MGIDWRERDLREVLNAKAVGPYQHIHIQQAPKTLEN
jgi:hypothetical protein